MTIAASARSSSGGWRRTRSPPISSAPERRRSSAPPPPATPRSCSRPTCPIRTGFSVCRTIRDQDVDAPIVFLSARHEVEDRIAGLESGADDYLGKPFAFRELLARVRAVSRRGPVHRGVVLEAGDLRLDATRHQVLRGDVPIDLSRKEFAVLEALMREPGTVLSRFDLLEQAWGYHYENRSNVVEVYIRYLREKIDRPFGRDSLQTVRGVGYRICVTR